MSFKLHPNLSKKLFVVDLPLCTVLLEDDYHYPWLILVPRRSSLSTLMHVSKEDHTSLFQELTLAQQVLSDLFKPVQINVAAIGNKTPQLHIHIIARFENDPAWPHTVWDHPIHKPYADDEKKLLVNKLQLAFCNDR